MNPETINIFQNLGLTAVESKTYLSLLELGKSLAGGVAKKARLHRRNTYDALEQLMEKGLVSYVISNKRKYWCAVHPEKIMSLISEKEIALTAILPGLISTFEGSKSARKVEVFEGLGGMKTFFDDMLNSKGEIIMLFATGRAYHYLPTYMARWDKELNLNKIRVKVLLNYGVDASPYTQYKRGQIKVLPRNFFTPTQIFIYGIKSCVAFWSENPLAILISSEDITAGFRKYVDILWKMGKKVK